MLLTLAVQGDLPDPNTVGPGMAGFITFFALFIAAIFLFKSLTKQIKRVDFPVEEDPNTPRANGPEGQPSS